MSCTCQECGGKYKVDVIIDDELWEKVKPAGKEIGAGLLCGKCILKKIELISDYSCFSLIKK